MPIDADESTPRAPMVTFDDRLLAESVRAAEALGSDVDASHADVQAALVDGTLEQKIVVRAKHLPEADRLQHALHQARTVATWLIVIALLFSLAAGAGAARTALGSERNTPVIVLPVLGGLLGVQLLLLVAWMAMWFIQPRSLSSSSLGGLLMQGVQFLARAGTRSAEHMAAVQAYAGVSMHSSIARWKTSAISHSMWTAFNIGCIALLLSLLSTRSYSFGWETTILPDDVYAPLIETIAWLPRQLGFTGPNADEIAASQWSGVGEPPVDPRNAWPSFLVGCLVVYGALPRILLLGMSLIGLKTAQRRFRLDTKQPGYVRLRSRLQPQSQRTGIVDGDDAIPHNGPRVDPENKEIATADVGQAAIVGIEIDQPQTGWPPKFPDITLNDLGRIESRDQRGDALRTLRDADRRPAHLVAVCALTTTPDRGIESMLQALADAARAPVVLTLTAGHTMRQRVDQEGLINRINDWHRLAARTGIDPDHIVEVDLDNATDASLQRLAGILGQSQQPAQQSRHIDQAFDVISGHCWKWNGRPSESEQLALHTEIARLYRKQSHSWLGDIQKFTGTSARVLDQIQEQARHSMSLLPGNLRATPMWALAGATAGAIGCLAVASIITPAALVALPGWATVGGGLSTVLHLAHKLSGSRDANSDDDANEGQARDSDDGFAQAVAAATVFALLLELQGRSEATITAILEQTVSPENVPPQTADHVPGWLDDVRHRLDLALAAHTGAAS